MSITDTHYADGVASSFDLAIGAGENAEGLYMAYGNLDGGDDINAWENVSKVADIPAATTTYAVAAPAGWGTSVTALRFFMATVADLPYEVQYEYIYSTGREYADTGYLATDSTKAAIDMAFLSCAAKVNVPVFGYRRTANADAFIFFIRPDQDKFYFEYNRPQANVANVHIDVGERFTFRNDNSDMYLARFGQPEQLIATGEPMDPFTAPAGFSILINGFKKSTTTSVDNQNLAMRIYGFRIWEGNELVRDYVPARKDGVVGLYDKMGGSMLGANIGATRSFANGPVAVVNGGFVSSSAAPATVFALGAPIAGSARRNVAIAETNRVAGAIVSLGLSFSASFATNYLYLAYGATDGGDDPADWDHLDFVQVVRPYEMSATVPVPEGWGADAQVLRFFLGDPPARPYDRDIEWLATTGSQWIDTGVFLQYGQTFTLVWRQYGLSVLYSDTLGDCGWGAGYSSGNTLNGGGTRNSNKIQSYILNGWKAFSPALGVGSLTTTAVYREVLSLGAPCTYTLTDLAGGTVWTGSSLPSAGSTYVSKSHLFLARGGDTTSSSPSPGKKAFYRATVETTSTGAPIIDLVPVVSNGVACLYDLVSGKLLLNAAEGDFIAGPEIEPRLPSTVFPSASGTLSLLGAPVVVATGAQRIDGNYAKVRIAYDVTSLGGASDVDVEIRFGPASDALGTTNVLASGVGLGPGTAELGGLAPGRTYYARLVARAGGAESDPSAEFSFTIPRLETSGGGGFRPFESIGIENGAVVATFATYAFATPLYVAYGGGYVGETTNGWEHVAKVADVAADATSATFALPAGWGADVKYLRLFFTGDTPAGLTVLNCITNSGSQYIDTGIRPNSSLGVEIDFQTTDTVHDMMLFGVRNTGYNFLCWIGNSGGAGFAPCIGSSGNLTCPRPGTSAGDRILCAFGPGGIYANGVTVMSAEDYALYDSGATSRETLLLMGLRTGTDVDSRKFHGTCYGFRAYTNDVCFMNLVPCVYEGAVGMWDAVSGVFFGNGGSGAFAAGATSSVSLWSFSDLLYVADVSAPLLGEVADDAGWRGDRLAVSGTLEDAGAGDCVLAVQTSRTGDFTDAVAWPCAGTYAAGDAFAAELFSADASSAAYIRPGETLWYRVKATDRAGMSDYSVPASVTPPAAYAIGGPAISTAGSAFTVTVPITAAGANTGLVWVAYSMNDDFMLGSATAKFAIPPDAASATVTGVAGAEGTLHYAIVVSNACATASWSSTSVSRDATLANNIRYTWKRGVAAGVWEDAANWDAPEGRFAYPTAASEAFFEAATTARVAIATSLAEVKTLDCATPDLDIVFHGGRERMLKVSTSFLAKATGGTICVSNLNFEVSRGDILLNAGRLLRICGGAHVGLPGGNLGVNGGPGRHFEISGGSDFECYGKFCVGGAGSTAVIDDARVSMLNAQGAFFLASAAGGGEIIVKGRNARLEATSYFRNDLGNSVGGTLTFVVPEGGYARTPVCHIPRRDNGQYVNTYTFAGDVPAQLSRLSPITIRIDPSSPGLSASRPLRQPLVSWKSGLSLEKMALEPVAVRPRINRFAYAAEFDDSDGPYGWETTWTDGEAPLTLGFIHEQAATVIMVR